MDILKMPKTQDGYCSVLSVICPFSLYPEAFPHKDESAQTIAETLHTHVLTHYPVVKEMVTDLGQAVIGKLMKALAQLFGIKKSQTTPYRPEGNSPAELLNRGLIFSL